MRNTPETTKPCGVLESLSLAHVLDGIPDSELAAALEIMGFERIALGILAERALMAHALTSYQRATVRPLSDPLPGRSSHRPQR